MMNIVLAMYTLSKADIETLQASAALNGLFFGILVGVGLACGMIFMLIKTYQINFKRYYLEVQEEDRKTIDEHLSFLFMYTEMLARKTNTRLFKSMYNNLVRIRALLESKFMQS